MRFRALLTAAVTLALVVLSSGLAEAKPLWHPNW